MESEQRAKAQALPPKGFPFPSSIPGLPGVPEMLALHSCGMWVQLEEAVPCFGGRQSHVLHPGKPKERVESRSRRLPAQYRCTGSPRTQPENCLIF